MTAHSTYNASAIAAKKAVSFWNRGPHNGQNRYFSTSDSLERSGYRDWQSYFDCPTAKHSVDLLACPCRDSVQPKSASGGACMLFGSLLANEAMAPYRNLGADGFLEWSPGGISLWPQSWIIQKKGTETTMLLYTPPGATYYSDEVYAAMVKDSRAFGHMASVTVRGHHNSRNWRSPDIGHVEVPRFDDLAYHQRYQAVSTGTALKNPLKAKPDLIFLETWNGWGESSHIEPDVDFEDLERNDGSKDPYACLRLIACERGLSFQPPPIPCQHIDPLRCAQICP